MIRMPCFRFAVANEDEEKMKKKLEEIKVKVGQPLLVSFKSACTHCHARRVHLQVRSRPLLIETDKREQVRRCLLFSTA
jgi:hypothetical protein